MIHTSESAFCRCPLLASPPLATLSTRESKAAKAGYRATAEKIESSHMSAAVTRTWVGRSSNSQTATSGWPERGNDRMKGEAALPPPCIPIDRTELSPVGCKCHQRAAVTLPPAAPRIL